MSLDVTALDAAVDHVCRAEVLAGRESNSNDNYVRSRLAIQKYLEVAGLPQVEPIHPDDIPELAQVFFERVTGQHPARISCEDQQKWISAMEWLVLTVLRESKHVLIAGKKEAV